ncbi:right-handed parallel beta-helix repeat-containing protein [Sandaracinobacteroides saxicola]|uniref:Right-handed parallel beta-helix repeat-containing protein n=1 Tax=Sandaracinobacteroides saxicola TaxID=2759707 RepID=A0A7G5ILK1_9SPHN|nr:right-handed parallel beta-helix repeat-containing protein [Sandaracinobacteroides saxicola]QMW24243.1 right-handed parallel beta-helix repeat-containing protein [Sandaracinobacteroides saxicola]
MIVTCATVVAALAAAGAGETLVLRGPCGGIAITDVIKAAPVTIDARGAEVRGLSLVRSGGVRWLGGSLSAPGGVGAKGPAGYALLVRDSRDISFDGVRMTDAMRGAVVDRSRRIAFANARFSGLRSDGMNIVASSDVTVRDSVFADFRPNPTQCALPGQVTPGMSRRDCVAAGGAWTDGDHPDAIQTWGGGSNYVFTGNSISGPVQGIGNFGPRNDPPPTNVVIERNVIRVSTPHGITMPGCVDCRISGNTLARADGARFKVVIRAEGSAVCGNAVADGGAGVAGCR